MPHNFKWKTFYDIFGITWHFLMVQNIVYVSDVQHTARRPESGPPGISIRPAKPTRPTDTVQHEKYFELVARLIDDFQQRIEDFRKRHWHHEAAEWSVKLIPQVLLSTKWNSLTFIMTVTWRELLAGMGSRQFCWSRGRGQGREVEAEARQGSNVINRGEVRQRQRARGRSEVD